MDIEWHPITDFYYFDSNHRCRHRKDPPRKMETIELCVQDTSRRGKIIHVGRSDTCRKHGPAEKVRKAVDTTVGVGIIQSVCG